jgi:uncharacterized damage-inducible protein DinB
MLVRVTGRGRKREVAVELDWIRRQLETAYRGPSWHAPSLTEALRGADAALAAARPLAAAHSVAELVTHAAAWKRVVTGWAGGAARRRVTPAQDWPEPLPWETALAGLERAHEALLEAVAVLDLSALERSLGDCTLGEALLGVAHHDLYHAGQIALLRRSQV